MTQANVLSSSNYINVTQHDDNNSSRMVPGGFPQTNFLLAADDAGSDYTSTCIADDEGDFVFQGQQADIVVKPKRQKNPPLTREQIAHNFELWPHFERDAKKYCQRHNNIQEHVEDVVFEAKCLFVSKNITSLKDTKKSFINNQCLMAARKLGYYNHRTRRNQYKGDGKLKLQYTAKNHDEEMAIQYVSSGELGVDDAIEYFDIVNPILVAHLHNLKNEYYAPKAATTSLDSMYDDCGDGIYASSLDSCVFPSLKTSAATLIDRPFEHNLSSDLLKSVANQLIAGVSISALAKQHKMKIADFKAMVYGELDTIEEDMVLEDQAIFGTPVKTIVADNDFAPAWNVGTHTHAEIVKLTKPVAIEAPVLEVSAPVISNVIDFKTYQLASKFYVAAVEAKESGISIKELAEAAEMTPAAFRGKLKRQENKIKQAVEAGQMLLPMFDAPAPAPVVEEVVEVQVADVATVEVAMAPAPTAETPELTTEQMVTVVSAIRSVRPTETSAVLQAVQTPSAIFQDKWIIPLSGTAAMPTINYGAGVQRYVSDAVDRGGGGDGWREAA